MRDYPCKKEVTKEIVKEKMLEIFGNVNEENGILVSSYPPLEKINVSVVNKKKIGVETKSGTSGDYDMAVKIYNKFLEEVTGYTAKERKKMAMKL